MNAHESSQDMIQQAHDNFAIPDEVVVDPALSKQEKSERLDAMEQDARLLATASAEGMSGGEPTNLHEVLDAKEALKEPPPDSAYELVLRDLRMRRAAGSRDGLQVKVQNAIDALAALQRADGAV